MYHIIISYLYRYKVYGLTTDYYDDLPFLYLDIDSVVPRRSSSRRLSTCCYNYRYIGNGWNHGWRNEYDSIIRNHYGDTIYKVSLSYNRLNVK